MVWNFDLPEMPAGPVMELHGARKRFHVPQGLKPLLEEMSLEVLREQPDNIYEFLENYLRRKHDGAPDHLAEKDGEIDLEEQWKLTSKKEDDKSGWLTLENDEVLLNENGILIYADGMHVRPGTKLFARGGGEPFSVNPQGKPIPLVAADADHYATVIQSAFRGHLERIHTNPASAHPETEKKKDEHETKVEDGENFEEVDYETDYYQMNNDPGPSDMEDMEEAEHGMEMELTNPPPTAFQMEIHPPVTGGESITPEHSPPHQGALPLHPHGMGEEEMTEEDDE